jgi:hypothetical protein
MLEARMKKARLSKTILDFDENGNKAQQSGGPENRIPLPLRVD